jgi:histidinol-phosphate aminotransferase
VNAERLQRRVPLIAPDAPALRSAAPSGGAVPEAVPLVRGRGAFCSPPRPPEIDLFLDSNEGPQPPEGWPADCRAALLQAVESCLLRSYPDAGAFQARWADRLGVAPERLLVTAGGDEATDRVCRAFLCPGREILLPVPTFEMLGHYAALTGAKTVELPWAPGEPYPIERVLERVTARTAVIAVVSPNNPTGAIATAEDLRRLAAAAPHAVILVDQAYVEFAGPECDLLPVAMEIPGVVVLRTLSKAWGLAGLRIGCAIGAPEIIGRLRTAGCVFPVAAPSMAIAEAFLGLSAAAGAQTWGAGYLSRVAHERRRLQRMISAFSGAEAWPSHANFVLARFSGDPDAMSLHAALWRSGISVRRMLPVWRAWSLDNCLRITCPGDLRQFDRLSGELLGVLSRSASVQRGA